ncbi:hypothetical protein A9Z40_01830 [Microbacterium arborescens]|uniref:Uncharacterized protein n=2 Tax=Microbacterium arborescens TaxID=33883 RepID=A0ABX2WK82_9MICO|nr:hypothetical protein A9Z40_01830 [Microbacterium arborescens]
MSYSLSIETDATDTFAIAGGTDPVRDAIHASAGGSQIREQLNANVILHWDGDEAGTSLQHVTKSTVIANEGTTLSPEFVPADFGWDVWRGGFYWFDVHVAQQGGMAAAVDTPDRDPRESWWAWMPDPDKDVIGSGEESGDSAHGSVNGMSVWPGQKLEYSVAIDLNIPAQVRPQVTSFAVRDSYDPLFVPDRSSVEFWDSRDAGSPRPVPRSAYTLSWDTAGHSFTATFTDEWVAANITGTSEQGWLTMRFTGTVAETAPAGGTVKNQAFQIVNGVDIATGVPEVTVPAVNPDKENLDSELNDIDGKVVVEGDRILYRLTLDANPVRDQLAYNVHKLGMVDDYDDEYLHLDADGITVTNKATGEDVTDRFNIQVSDGFAYVFAKQVDSTNAFGELIPGEPQPADLAVYDQAPIDPHTTPIIDQSLMGHQYWIVLDTKVKKQTDGHVIRNQAVQNIQNVRKATRIVSNPLVEIDPEKDVIAGLPVPGSADQSINGQEIALESTFAYRLDSSVLPANRAYGASEWALSDTFDRVHDYFTGTWAVYAARDLYDGDSLVAAEGELVEASSGDGADRGLFDVTFDEGSYTLTVTATEKYLTLVNSRGDLPAAFSVYTQMIRIAPSERVENVTTETLNGVERVSDVVWTSTPENPAISVVKYTLDEGIEAGDRNTAAEAYPIPEGEMQSGTRIGIRVTNTGDVPLRNVTVTDHTHEGLHGTVSDLVCAGSAPNAPAGVIGDLAVGASVDCEAVLTGMAAGQLHGNTVTATGNSVYSGEEVTDSDPWFARGHQTPALALTGGAADLALYAGIAGALLVLGAAVVVTTRRRQAASK